MRNITALACLITASVSQAHAQTQIAAAPNEPALEAATAPRAEQSANTWELSSGFDSSRGTYGALQPTTVSYVPVGLSYKTPRWTISLESGYVHVKGPLNYIDITNLDGRTVTLGPNTAVKGIADTNIGLKYAIYENLERGLFVDVGARLRTPTASRTKGLGTGHVGGDLQLDLAQVLGQWTIFGGVEYGIRDSRDAERNPFSASAGVARAFTDRWSVGGFYSWRQSVRRTARSAHELFAYTSYRFNDRFSLTFYGATGFSPESVDREIGLRYSLRWQ